MSFSTIFGEFFESKNESDVTFIIEEQVSVFLKNN